MIADRSREGEGGYEYGLVDEYESTFEVMPATSAKALTLAELIRLIDTPRSATYDLRGRPFVEEVEDHWQRSLAVRLTSYG